MTSFRMRILTIMMLVFAAVPTLAQEETAVAATVNPAASLGCLLAGLAALGAVGFLSHARDLQGEQDPTVQPKPDEMANTPETAPSVAPTA
jgi:hypothetical protein